jgi:N-acetylmuramoyl-L-alanine amidase
MPVAAPFKLNSARQIETEKLEDPAAAKPNFVYFPFKPNPPDKRGANQGLIVLDAGHGGDDFGTHSDGKGKLHEKNLNLSTTQMVKSYLQESGYQVAMTRSDDLFISLEERANFANEVKPLLFVSIHYNSAPSKEADGIEVFYYQDDENKSRTRQSMQLAQAVLDKVIKNTKAKSRGIKHGNLAVIRRTNMPAILIEGGFMTNPKEMEKLRDPAYQKSIAQGIAQGVQAYLAKQKVLR